MPTTKQAGKRQRQNAARRQRNRSFLNSVRTAVRRFDEALSAGESEAAAERLRNASSVLDRAVSKGVVTGNTAARTKRRLNRRFHRANASAASAAS